MLPLQLLLLLLLRCQLLPLRSLLLGVLSGQLRKLRPIKVVVWLDVSLPRTPPTHTEW